MKSPELQGMIFGRLTVVGRSDHKQVGRNEKWWACQCACGQTSLAKTHALTSGKKKSCGCLGPDLLRKQATTHGKTNTRAFVAWRNMIQRCERPSHPQYADYGGRGIGVCERWHDVATFMSDMGEPPNRHTLERIDNECGYSPENCRWATQKEQLRNRRNTVWATFDGEKKSLAEWCDLRGLEYVTVISRVRKGASPEMAIEMGPANRKRPKRSRLFERECGDFVAKVAA